LNLVRDLQTEGGGETCATSYGAVWYHRESPGQEPPPEALAVLQAIIDARLPVKLVEKDFY